MSRKHENQADLPFPLFSEFKPNRAAFRKFLRKTIINTKFYRKKHEFRDAVLKSFDNIASYRTRVGVASNSELPRA